MNGVGAISMVGAITLAAVLGGCVSDRCTGMSAPTPKETQPDAKPAPAPEAAAAPETKTLPVRPAQGTTATATSHPAIEFIPEMEPYPAQFRAAAPNLSPEESERFKSAWQTAAAEVESGTTSAKLVEISRWATKETASAKLDRGWAVTLPLQAIAATSDGRRVLFGLSEAQQSSVVLPTHSAVVSRRLLAASEYDRDSGTIPRVYVTIRGWAEE